MGREGEERMPATVPDEYDMVTPSEVQVHAKP